MITFTWPTRPLPSELDPINWTLDEPSVVAMPLLLGLPRLHVRHAWADDFERARLAMPQLLRDWVDAPPSGGALEAPGRRVVMEVAPQVDISAVCTVLAGKRLADAFNFEAQRLTRAADQLFSTEEATVGTLATLQDRSGIERPMPDVIADHNMRGLIVAVERQLREEAALMAEQAEIYRPTSGVMEICRLALT